MGKAVHEHHVFYSFKVFIKYSEPLALLLCHWPLFESVQIGDSITGFIQASFSRQVFQGLSNSFQILKVYEKS